MTKSWDLDAEGWRALFQRFLDLPTANREEAMSGAADLVAEISQADKVDAFVYDTTRRSLVALGTSHQPLSALQRQSGLDVLPLANGGRNAEVFTTGKSFLSGQLDQDMDELPGVRITLGVRSLITVPIWVGTQIEGVFSLASQRPNLWDESSLQFVESIAGWVSIISHRAQLIAEREEAAREQGRVAAAEELVTVLAHDLRNLMAPMLMHLQILRRRAKRDGRTQDLENLEPALASFARIDGLTTDLLDVARIDHGLLALRLEATELVALAEEVARGLTTPDQPVQVQAYEPMTALVDVARLRQSLENLIANAVAHSPPGARVLVTLGREHRASETFVSIEVSDEGPGIPEHLLPRIFERFVTDKQARGAGLGLGLFLARAIATAHRGQLTVTSHPGAGTSFLLKIPCLDEA